MANAIELRGLTRWYGKRRGVVDLDVAVEEGEVFGFLGPNGAGKTTTIRMLLGLIRPSAGTASVWGLDAWRDAPAVHRRLAHLGSDPGYLGELTAGADARPPRRRCGACAKGAWRPLAERLELDPGGPVKKLSRGNRQKVGVVQAFMGTEPLLVMDEPSTGLDPLMQREFLALVAEARAAGRTVFLSSHNLTEVERACDRVAIIREGRLVKIATVAALVGDHTRSVNLVLARPGRAGDVRPARRHRPLEHRPGRPPDGPRRREPAPAPPGRPRGPRHRDLDAGRRGPLLPLLRRLGGRLGGPDAPRRREPTARRRCRDDRAHAPPRAAAQPAWWPSGWP